MESTENGPSSCKQRKLSQNQERDDRESGDLRVSENPENGDNTQESGDTEEYSNTIFSQDTQEYLPEIINDNDNVPKLNKLESVMRDAKFIGDILDQVDVADIYNKLKAIRQNPNRIDVVTNQLLENQSKLKSPSNGLMQDFVKIIDLSTTNMTSLPVSAEEIQQLLNSVQNRADRVDFVFSNILGLHCLKRQGHGDLVKDVTSVLVQCNGVPFDEVSKMMMKNQGLPDRIQRTADYFLQLGLNRADSAVSNSSLANDQLYKETRIIAKVMPEVDRNEIYAYLEAHHNEKNRILIVMEELMKIRPDGESIGSLDVNTNGETAFQKVGRGIFNIQDEVDELRQIFPDCDPNYLFEQLEEKADDKERMKTVAMAIFEKKDYPKLKEREEREKKISTRNRIKNLEFHLEEFLLKFPDPVAFFGNDEKKMNENYMKHVKIQIRNDFPELKGKYIKKVLEKHNNHYTTTWKEIHSDVADDRLRGVTKKFKAHQRMTVTSLPEDPDEYFYYEKLYCHHENIIKDHLEEKERLLKLKREEAKSNRELFECGCCFDDECFFEDLSVCAEGHLFCKECIRRSSEVVIGDSKTKFPCLLDTCKEEFPLSVLQQILPSNMFSILLRRLQEEEIKQADIPDLVTCPFCSFATIMPEEDKVFKCLNSECLKESCRLCGEPNHVPYRCDEVEKQGETNMRTFIEAKLSEAMLRTCHRCQKHFVKEIGCNKMTCVCGASMCYVCREPDIDYDHFGANNCNEGDMKKLHVKEMREAAIAAKEKYLQDHPECAEIDLKFDPIKLVEEYEADGGGRREDYDEDEEEYDEDY